MTTMISDLPRDLIEEIFSRVPLKSMRSVRLTCKKWDILSKSGSFTKIHIARATATREGESQMIMMIDYNVYLMSVFMNDVDASVERKGKLTYLEEQVKISQVFHCEGLLLCILKDSFRLVVWNPYLGQTRWIEPRYSHPSSYKEDGYRYAIGYVEKKDKSCRSIKVLRFLDDTAVKFGHVEPKRSQILSYEIYHFDSDSWTTLDINPNCHLWPWQRGVSLNGNTYWCATKKKSLLDQLDSLHDHIICFDFTRERFGPRLPLPFSAEDEYYYGDLSCVREEKLAVLLQHKLCIKWDIEIWITTKIESEKLSWSKFFKLDGNTRRGNLFSWAYVSFFIDEEKKVAMSFNKDYFRIIGEDGYLRNFDLGNSENIECNPHVCSYVPSLVQIKKVEGGKRKRKNNSEKGRFDQNKSRLVAIERQIKKQDALKKRKQNQKTR